MNGYTSREIHLKAGQWRNVPESKARFYEYNHNKERIDRELIITEIMPTINRIIYSCLTARQSQVVFLFRKKLTQITINAFSKWKTNEFHRSRFVDLQDFFKKYSTLEDEDIKIMGIIEKRLDTVVKHLDDNLKFIKNRALAVTTYLFISNLIEENRENEITPRISAMRLKTTIKTVRLVSFFLRGAPYSILPVLGRTYLLRYALSP